MNAYFDTSVLLRSVLREPGSLSNWGGAESGLTSAITEVECLRALDRQRLNNTWTEEDIAERYASVHALLAALDRAEVSPAVLHRAGWPLPVPLGTLDAIHLSTALLWEESLGEPVTLATHDARLASAARASGLQVIGV